MLDQAFGGRNIYGQVIGILMLRTSFPRIPGDIGNASTFPFPVRYKVVEEATADKVLNPEGDPTLLAPFVRAARELEQEGVKAIFTSCGFLAIFHRELVDAVDIPVFSSSLLQVPTACAVIKKTRKVGILSASAGSLTPRHFAGVGLLDPPVLVRGLEGAEEFNSVFIGGKPSLDVARCTREIVDAAKGLVGDHPEIGALVLECTNMAPFSHAIQAAVGLPVFDVVTMIRYAYSTLVQTEYQGFM
ncbi:MAG: aspartate/glutamate racemase family protein [Thermodesulfobacteriota bacterium]